MSSTKVRTPAIARVAKVAQVAAPQAVAYKVDRRVSEPSPRELAISTQSAQWKGRPHHRRLPRVASALIVLAAALTIAGFSVVKIREHLHNMRVIDIHDAVLTADQRDIVSQGSGTVSKVSVANGELVTKGQVVAVVDYIVGDQFSGKTKSVDMTAIVSGIVSDVAVVPGSVVFGGSPLVRIYETAKMFFEVSLPYEEAVKLHARSVATFDVPGIGTVEAVTIGIQPDFGAAGTGASQRLSRVLLRPTDPASIDTAVPGLIVTGTIVRKQ